MPVRVRKKRAFRRRPYRRGRNPTNRKNQSVSFIKSPSVIPDRIFLKLRYHENVLVTATAVPNAFLFQSSIFDPTVGGVGHQPMGRDEWSTFYNRFKVYGIKYDIQAINTDTTQQSTVATLQKPATTAITTQNQLWETAYSRCKVLGVEASGQAVGRWKGYMDCAKVLGVSKARYNTDDLYSGTNIGNPNLMAYLHMIVAPADSISSVQVRFHAQLTFYVSLFERHTLLPS